MLTEKGSELGRGGVRNWVFKSFSVAEFCGKFAGFHCHRGRASHQHSCLRDTWEGLCRVQTTWKSLKIPFYLSVLWTWV